MGRRAPQRDQTAGRALPSPDIWVHRGSSARRWRLAVWALGALVFVAGACYGLRGPFVWGHFGYHAGEYATRARHTLENGAVLPGNVPGISPPRPGTYYLHHPILTHQLVTLTFGILGDRESSVRLASLLAAGAMLVLLGLFVARHHGPWFGAAAFLLSAVVPFNVWYAAHIDPGYPGLACLMAAALAYGRWLESGSWRAGTATLGALAGAGLFDWTPFLFAVPVGLHVLVIGVVRRGRYLGFIPAFVVAVLLPAGVHALAVHEAHQWDDLFGAYHQRSATMPLAAFAARMNAYGKDLFGFPLLVAGAIGFLLALVALVRGPGGARALLLVALVFAITVHVLVFRIEVVTHAYRLIYFAPVVVLGTMEALLWLVRLLRVRAGRTATAAAASLVTAGLIAATLPTSWQGAIESRAHSGIPGWKTLEPSLPRAWLARSLTAETAPGDLLYLHPSIPYRMEIGFYLKRDFVPALATTVASLPAAARDHGVFAFVAAALGPAEWAAVSTLAHAHPYARFGPFGVVDLRRKGPKLESATFVFPDPAGRSFWRRYWEGPYVWPELAADPVAAVRDALAFGLPASALAHPPLTWPAPAPGDVAALVEARNANVWLGATAATTADEAALLQQFPLRGEIAREAEPPAPGSSTAAPAVAPPAPPVAAWWARRTGPTTAELLVDVAREGALYDPGLLLPGKGEPRALPALPPPPTGRHAGQWIWEHVTLPPDAAMKSVTLELFASGAPPGKARRPFATVVLPSR